MVSEPIKLVGESRLCVKNMARLCLVCLVWLGACELAGGCNVPVFRFALERWVSDNYALVVAHDKVLTPAQRELTDRLLGKSTENGGKANLSVQVLDLAATPADPTVKYLPLENVALPAVFLFFPASFGEPTLIWQAALTTDSVAHITGSPLRDEFVAQAATGTTALWILLESGQPAEDAAAEQVLRESLAAVQQESKLPAGVVHPAGAVPGGSTPATADNGYFDPENQLDSGIPLRIGFEVVRMPAGDPREDVLRGMLLKVVPGLLEKRERPLAFPLFGRGRILAPLAGDEIRHESITAIARYLCGPCACQVKAQNPGVDMLLDVDWEAKLAGVSAIAPRTLPPLSGTAAITGQAPVAPSLAPSVADQPAATGLPGPMLRNGLLASATVVLLVIAATFGILRRRP